MTKNMEILAVGGYDQKIRIYTFNGTSFTFKEEINVGFVIIFLKISHNKLIVAGISTLIKFYQHNGTSFILSDTISTNDPILYKVHID